MIETCFRGSVEDVVSRRFHLGYLAKDLKNPGSEQKVEVYCIKQGHLVCSSVKKHIDAKRNLSICS